MTIWNTITKNVSIFTGITKNSTVFSNQAKSMGTNDFLLLEDGFYLLLEDGFKLILEQSSPSQISWTNATKN